MKTAMQISRPSDGHLPECGHRATDKQAVVLGAALQEIKLNPPRRHHGRATVRAAGILTCIEGTKRQ